MKRTLLLLLALLLVLSAGCAGEEDSAPIQLWFPTVLDSEDPPAEAVAGEPYTGTPGVTELMSALLAGPADPALQNPFPNGTRLLGAILTDGVLHLDMSSSYGNLTGIGLTLADYCITLTMCQLEDVEEVYITVSGNEVAYRSRQQLSPDDVIFTGAEEEPRLMAAVLYFPRAAGSGLGFEVRELTLTEDDDLYLSVTQTLMDGPQSGGLRSLMPEGVQLLGVRLDGGICYVNLSAAFVEEAPADLQEQDLLLYSLVDTLGNLDAVTAVQLLVEDQMLPQYGTTRLDQPLEPDFKLVGGG